MNDYQRLRAIEAKFVDYFQNDGWAIDNAQPEIRAHYGYVDEDQEDNSVEVNLTELARLVLEG